MISEKEHPCAAQIFGDDPEIMAKAAKKAGTFSPDFIDINMGCPAPKIAGNGGGSALLKNPELISKIVREVRIATELPLTVKIRIGWDQDSINCTEVAKICEAEGADAITVHGRTKSQMYAPPVNYEMIKAVKEAVKIPVIGNGDITDIESAERMLNETGCDFLMVGRGALGNPWIFRKLNAYFSDGTVLSDPTVEERMEQMLAHIRKLVEYKGEYIGMREARKHAAWYIKGMRGAASFRQEIGKLEHIEELEYLAKKIVKKCR